MDEKLKNKLKGIITGHRPRPLMYIGRVNGKKCYCRKRDLTYWQLREKYPSKPNWKNIGKLRHILAPQHHLTPRRLQRKICSYVVWGGLIGFAALCAVLYLAGFYVAIL